MRRVSQVDIAPTIASLLGVSMPGVDGKPMEEVEGWSCRRVLLLIIDSLGCDLFRCLEDDLRSISSLASHGLLLRAEAVSNHTSPAIASILSGLLPLHHQIFDTAGAKGSSILSLPEMASLAGLRTAVIMEKGGAEVYDGKIEIVRGIPDTLSPEEFDQEACRSSIEALSLDPKLMVSYFIGIDKAAHLGLDLERIREAAISIDGHVGAIAAAARPGTMLVICGDHPIHAGRLKVRGGLHSVPLVLGRKGSLGG